MLKSTILVLLIIKSVTRKHGNRTDAFREWDKANHHC